MFSDCTNLSTIKSKKILDISIAKCYNHNCQGEILLSHDTSGASVGRCNKRELRKARDGCAPDERTKIEKN